MSKLVPITIACAEYDRTRPIKDGRVRVDGCEVTYLALDPEELFFRAFRYQDFDIAELSFNSYLMATSRNACGYVAVPPISRASSLGCPNISRRPMCGCAASSRKSTGSIRPTFTGAPAARRSPA